MQSARMRWALRHTVILGDLTTNIPFLCDLLDHPVFVSGSATTDFVDREFVNWCAAHDVPPDEVLIAAALDELLVQSPAPGFNTDLTTGQSDQHSPWWSRSGFRLGVAPDTR